MSDRLSKRSVQFRSQKRFAAKPTLNSRRADARMRRPPLYQRSHRNLIFGMHMYLMELHILSGERSRSSFKVRVTRKSSQE
ncbi:hypothetical protein DPMN_032618 [Dreissena polymorpha]|uniref:Uncharacterized protein n=1 Tax=Dreissena polymorpha TaxID=45954 RepID=A0A9D4M498_DREPO|nr:hypothetical protein DPMN_032618 [Dreissena polymorpha]